MPRLLNGSFGSGDLARGTVSNAIARPGVSALMGFQVCGKAELKVESGDSPIILGRHRCRLLGRVVHRDET
jgi:hypothetical protein